MWKTRLRLHLQSGAAIQTTRMGKAFIDTKGPKKLFLDYEDTDETDIFSPEELEDIINTEINDNNSVTVWFMPQTENSIEVSVPVTQYTKIRTDETSWDSDALEKEGVIERAEEHLENNHGTYNSGP
jgi:hypothetical protein